jgi:RNA polymerase sigma-70 factor, ECF subfamily
LPANWRRSIAHAVEKLPPGCRKVFELSRVEGLKYREIAEALQISVKTVEIQMSKALKTLRISLSDYISSLLFVLINWMI